MDELLIIFVILMFVITFLLIKFPTSRNIFSKPKKTPFPPGRTSAWAIIGETMEFYSMGKKGTLEKFYMDRMKKYSPNMFSTCLLGINMVVMCGPEANKFLFSNEKKLVTVWLPECMRKIFPHITSNVSDMCKSFNQNRKIASVSIMKPDVLKSYLGIMDHVAKKLLSDQWDGKEKLESVMPLIKQYNIVLACRLLFGIEDPKNIIKFGKQLGVIMAGIVSIPVDLPGTRLNRAVKASTSLREEIVEIINGRNKESSMQPDDLITHMLTTTDENGEFRSKSIIAENLIGLALAGTDTMTIAMALIMKYLAEIPQIYDNVLRELREIEFEKSPGELLNWSDLRKMKYSWNIACEVMRLAPPSFGTFREAITDFTFDGFFIPKGTKLHWSPYSSHRNPEYFPKPEEFDPSRFDDSGPTPYTYIPFGGGSRMCPGREYAKLEILAFMYNVVRKFRWEKILPNENVIVDIPIVKIANGLPVRLHVN